MLLKLQLVRQHKQESEMKKARVMMVRVEGLMVEMTVTCKREAETNSVLELVIM